MAASPSVVTEDTPHLESADRVLDACTSTAMPAPRGIAHDAASAKGRCDELGNAAIAAVGEYTPVPRTQRLDLRTTVVDWIVAIARAARSGRDDLEVTMTHEHLCIAGVPVILGLRRVRVVAGRNQRAVDDPRPAPIARGRLVDERCKFGGNPRDDPVRRRLGDLEYGGELPNR